MKRRNAYGIWDIQKRASQTFAEKGKGYKGFYPEAGKKQRSGEGGSGF